MPSHADEVRATAEALKELQRHERSLVNAIELPRETRSISAFLAAQASAQASLDRQLLGLRDISALVSPYRGIADSMTSVIREIESSMISPITEEVRRAQAAMESIRTSPIAEEVRRAQAAMESIRTSPIAEEVRRAAQAFASLKLQPDFARFCRLADLSQALAAKIPLPSVSELWQVSSTKAFDLINSVHDLATTAERFYSPWKDRPAEALWIPEPIRSAPVIECFNATDVLVSRQADQELPEPIAETRQEIHKEVDESLLQLLGQDHPDLVEMLQGSRAAFAQRRPDRVRHFITSLRELFTHVIHRLAPDDNIKAWSTCNDDYDKGRPTRRARLRYICRGIVSPEFEEFVAKDVTAMLELVGLLQGGTHAVKSNYSEAQLRVLQVRVESLLRYLLQFAKEGR